MAARSYSFTRAPDETLYGLRTARYPQMASYGAGDGKVSGPDGSPRYRITFLRTETAAEYRSRRMEILVPVFDKVVVVPRLCGGVALPAAYRVAITARLLDRDLPPRQRTVLENLLTCAPGR